MGESFHNAFLYKIIKVYKSVCQLHFNKVEKTKKNNPDWHIIREMN